MQEREIFVFVYLEFIAHWRIFHSYGDVTIAGEGLQILTYARHPWPLSSEGSLMCHNHCDTGLPFIMVISEDPWHSHLMPTVWRWSCHYLFLRLRSVASSLAKGFAHGPLSLQHFKCQIEVKREGTVSETIGQRRWVGRDRGSNPDLPHVRRTRERERERERERGL